ncbi:hypothetical protein EDD85DRAFT_1030114 [Armillaria nabsnona]|nr:hypothetical protein EDD85DRAFT_1030114 [Armillaria nabsnona]
MSSDLQVLQMFSPRMSLLRYPTRQGRETVSRISLLDLRVFSFGDLDLSSTGPFFDGINTEMHTTNTLVAHACSDAPVPSLSSSPPNFESTNVASTVPDVSRRDSPLFSTSSSSSETSLQSQSSIPPIFQPTDVAFTPADTSRSYRDHTVDDFGLLDPPPVEGDMTDDIWDHRVHYETVGGEYDGTGLGSSLPVQESSQARPHAAHSSSVFMPFLDAYAAASSSKTTLDQAFDQDQAASQAVAITDAKFNTFGRIGRSTASKGKSKKAKRKPYQKSPHGPKPST